MRNLISMFLILLSFSAFSSENSSLRGESALVLADGLSLAGAYGEGHAGKVDVQAKRIFCQMSGNATGNRSYSCQLTTLNEEGVSLIKKEKGLKASSLFHAMADAGIESEGHAGSVSINVLKISCTISGNATGKRSAVCDIQL